MLFKSSKNNKKGLSEEQRIWIHDLRARHHALQLNAEALHVIAKSGKKENPKLLKHIDLMLKDLEALGKTIEQEHH